MNSIWWRSFGVQNHVVFVSVRHRILQLSATVGFLFNGEYSSKTDIGKMGPSKELKSPIVSVKEREFNFPSQNKIDEVVDK